MNAFASPYVISPKTAAVISAPRDVEYSAFSRVTAALKAAQAGDDPSARIAALHQNSNLWNTLLADLALPENGLPAALRGSLASLALFSIRHGIKAMSSDLDISPLIEVNLSIMRGLRGEVGG